MKCPNHRTPEEFERLFKLYAETMSPGDPLEVGVRCNSCNWATYRNLNTGITRVEWVDSAGKYHTELREDK